MTGQKSLFFPFFMFCFFSSCSVPALGGGDAAVYDDYWSLRASQAKISNNQSYHPDPQEVTDHLNLHVHSFLTSENSTRRMMRRRVRKKKKKYSGPCMATNPIDSCWRCDPNWADNRQRLADCGLGFGRNAKGGKGGPTYVVTDNSDKNVDNPKEGTLRHAVVQNGPLWIVFQRSMVIKLTQELILTSNKTIDGRGCVVQIANGAGITVQFIKNVIIHGIKIKNIIPCSGGIIMDAVGHHGLRTESDGDGISIFGSSDVWIDHVAMSNCQDGLIDAIMASTAITISNSRFTHHNDVMLFGASNSHVDDKIMQITVCFNKFGRGLVQRMPRCRFGLVHVVNNDYTHWLMYAMGGNMAPTIISQGNRFIAPPNIAAKEVTKRESTEEAEWRHWVWRSEGDDLMNGATFAASGDPNARFPYTKEDLIDYKPGIQVSLLTQFAGALECKEKEPC